MRITLIGCLLGIIFWSRVPLAAAGPPIPNEAQTAANFLLTTCQDSADNLAAVTQRAKQKNWASMVDLSGPEKGPLKLIGMWRVSQNGQSYIVVTGTGPRGMTTCQVMFKSPMPHRDDFMAAISLALTLKTDLDQTMPDMRQEMYQIVNLAPKNVVLQVASSPDGSVFEASINSR